jgi:hypothetical protein
MPFDPSHKHADYVRMLPEWQKLRDVIDARVKEKGTTYLPMLEGQNTNTAVVTSGTKNTPQLTSYTSYRDRAVFLQATSRTRDGMTGFITRKKPDIKWPEERIEELEQIGASLESFSEIQQSTLDENIGIGRYGHLVDAAPFAFDTTEPYIAEYQAETIVDWAWGRVNGLKAVIMVNLEEEVETYDTKGQPIIKERHRMLLLGVPEFISRHQDDTPAAFFADIGLDTEKDFINGPVYYQEVWDEVEGNDGQKGGTKQFTRTSVHIPRMQGGSAWNELPWTFFNPLNLSPKPSKPMLSGIAEVNLSHYKNSADLEHGAHFTALPQPWAAGFKFKSNVYIGSGMAWITEEPQARAGFLEFTGKGLGTLMELMEKKKKEMAGQGARLIEEQPREREAEGTVKLRQSGEGSVLSRAGSTTSRGLTRSLRFVDKFKRGPTGGGKDVGIVLNEDLSTEMLSPDTLRALQEAVIGGTISWNTYFDLLKRGEIIPEDVTMEEEAIRIQAGPPVAEPAITAPTTPATPAVPAAPAGASGEE